MKHNGNEQSLQLSFITGFDKKYLHAMQLTGTVVSVCGGGGWIQFTPMDLHKLSSYDADKLWWT